MEKKLISWLFLKLLGYQLSANTLIFNFLILKRNEKNEKKLVDIGSPLRKCTYHAFIIQNLDDVTLELGMKVQFANFWQIGHTKISAVHW
jgi:hypothetical protein